MFNNVPPMVAGGTIAPASFVKISTAADNTVLQGGDGDRCQFAVIDPMKGPPGFTGSDVTIAAIAGDLVTLRGIGDAVDIKVGAGGTVTHGDEISCDSGGLAQTADSADWVCAFALQSGAIGAKVRMLLISPYLKA